MKKFILLYDCPIDKCDKIWLYEGLKKYGDVKLIKTGINITYFKLSRKFSKIKLGRIATEILIYIQSIKALVCSDKNDIIVTWGQNQGIILNRICKLFNIKRKIVSFCWIELPRKKRSYRKVKNCLKNKNFIPIINNVKLEEQFKEFFNLSFWNGIYLPDVFDDNDEWLKPNFNKKNKYIFAGGANNRDWETLIAVAKETPKINYIIVAGKDDINDKKTPNNIKIFKELPVQKYYELMKNSFMTICPLKEDRVSGLINIIKSIQYGIPCIATNLDVTSIYYPNSKKNLLYNRNDKENLKKSILDLYSFSQRQYIDVVMELQNYLQNNFNPEKNIENLMQELRRRNLYY